MSAASAVCDSLMNTAQVVCIDHSDNRPSFTPERRTKAITVSVRSTSSIRSLVSTSMVSATTVKPPALTDVVLATGVSLTVTTELLLIRIHSIGSNGFQRFQWFQRHCSVGHQVRRTWVPVWVSIRKTDETRTGREAGCKAHTVPPL